MSHGSKCRPLESAMLFGAVARRDDDDVERESEIVAACSAMHMEPSRKH